MAGVGEYFKAGFRGRAFASVASTGSADGKKNEEIGIPVTSTTVMGSTATAKTHGVPNRVAYAFGCMVRWLCLIFSFGCAKKCFRDAASNEEAEAGGNFLQKKVVVDKTPFNFIVLPKDFDPAQEAKKAVKPWSGQQKSEVGD
jgi:hypothetical protein